MSSHFMPLPRSMVIRASSSADHFDCFLMRSFPVGELLPRFDGTIDCCCCCCCMEIWSCGAGWYDHSSTDEFGMPISITGDWNPSLWAFLIDVWMFADVLESWSLIVLFSSSSGDPRSFEISTLLVTIYGTMRKTIIGLAAAVDRLECQRNVQI